MANKIIRLINRHAAIMAIADVQRQGGLVAYIDTEHSLDPTYTQSIRHNRNGLIVAQPKSGKELFAICEQLAKSGELKLMVINTITALPEESLEVLSAMRKLSRALKLTHAQCYVVNPYENSLGIIEGLPMNYVTAKALAFCKSPYFWSKLRYVRYH